PSTSKTNAAQCALVPAFNARAVTHKDRLARPAATTGKGASCSVVASAWAPRQVCAGTAVVHAGVAEWLGSGSLSE
ncbi:MAG TPA: hypothetical protein VN871_00755, partial [Mycobacterium sp.]|nr:hypothetical protein [Mycobacterium sp.]